MRPARTWPFLAVLLASACSTVASPPADLAGEYEDRAHEPPLFVGLSADGEYLHWWFAISGLSISRPWVHRMQPSGKESVTLEYCDGRSLSFTVATVDGAIVLVGTDSSLRLKRKG